MSNITEILLKKYYGFNADPDNKKFISSHEATYDPCKFYPVSDPTEVTKTETIEDAATRGTIPEDLKKGTRESNNEGNAIESEILRSSRVISGDDIPEEETNDIDELDLLLPESTEARERNYNKDAELPEVKNPSTPKPEEKEETKELFNRKESVLMSNFEDVLSENVSDISLLQTGRKKPAKTKSAQDTSTLSSRAPEVPKKLPSCNGIFLDLTKLSLNQFPNHLLTNFPNLRMLYLENNLLTKIPDELFTNLRRLQWLDVRNNRIQTLPDTLKYHPCLETILLDGNLFEKLPLELCLVPNLKALQTSRNPLIFPPADIIALGFAATMHFLRSEWNKKHPENIVDLPEKNKKPKPSTILCSDPPVLKMLLKHSKTSSNSSTSLGEETKKISVRQKARNYKPSNRCENRGRDEELEKRLLWIAKVKEMLTKQSFALQKIKDRNTLNNWRRDRRSYEKSLSKAANRTEEDIPFAIDLEENDLLYKHRLKMPLPNSNAWKRDLATAKNINEKMSDLFDSLNRLQNARKSETLSPRSEQKLLENEIKKLSDVQNEIENLRRCNVMTTASVEGSKFLPEVQRYKPPPSIII